MAIKLVHSDSAPVMRAFQKSDIPSSSISYVSDVIVLSGNETSFTQLDDSLYRTYTSASYKSTGIINAYGNRTLISLDPNVATVSQSGVVTYVSNGTCRILAKNGITLRIDINSFLVPGQSTTTSYYGVVVGCLSEHFSEQVDSRIDNTMTMNTNGKVYSTQDHSTPNYVRNSNLWCADIDLTCISPWNSRAANKRAGTLITPRHVLNAAHYPLYNGDTIRFIEDDGTVHTRTIIGSINHPDYSPYTPDFRLYTLDSDLPAAISPCKMMPADHGSYLVNNSRNRPAAFGLDQEEKALIIDWRGGGSFLAPTDADRAIFNENKISGDSGNPSFLILNGSLVLITVWTYGGSGSGTPVADYIDDIDAMIVTADAQAGVSTGYTVTEADFSAFPSY